MSDTIATGVISKCEKGRFENQYVVDIEGQDRTFSAQVYSRKKDGDESKVWPLVQQSLQNGTAFEWKGNSKKVQTQHGEKTYHTITWAELVGDATPAANGNGSSWGPEAGTQEKQEPTGWGSPLNGNGEAAPLAQGYDRTTCEIEAAWALALVMNTHPNLSPKEAMPLAAEVVEAKRDLARAISSRQANW